jgi:hypothetical protein
MAILNNSNAISSGGYDINNSLRFRSSASAYLNRTPATTTNQTTFTFSFWLKRGSLGVEQFLYVGRTGSNFPAFAIRFNSNDTLQIDQYTTGGTLQFQLTTTQVFRDPSAWYHIVIAFDTTQGTSSNRIKFYSNGSQITSFSTATYPSSSLAVNVNTTNVQYINSSPTNGSYSDCYMAEYNFIDGSAKTPSDFGETDTTTGSWKPKAYTGTYGTNGFYLKFSDIATTSGSNAGLGKDFSGNANYWTTNNISVTAGTTYDAMIDSPTLTSATVANYATLNPLQVASATLSNANLSMVRSASGYGETSSTFSPEGNKGYFEITRSSTGDHLAGFILNSISPSTNNYTASGSYWYQCDTGNVRYGTGGSTAALITGCTSAPTGSQIIMVAFDFTGGNRNVWFGLQGTWGVNASSQTGVPSTGAFPHLTTTQLTDVCRLYFSSGDANTFSINFGQRPFSYTPPTGFVRLNTYNLPDSTIKKGNTVMDATLYTGTGASQTIVNAGAFKPDLVWIKQRSSTEWNTLADSIRGTNKQLFSNSTNAEQTNATFLTAFASNGFTVDTSTGTNGSGSTYVGWQWQAGQGTNTSNTSGSITSTVSVNATAGFSVVTFTQPASGSFTIGHGLGVAPKMIIGKDRTSASTNWVVYHSALSSPQSNYLTLNTTNAVTSSTNIWNNTAPTSTVISSISGYIANSNSNTVLYCWAEIAGFSKFTSYTGNGSTDGPFIFLGFRPKFVMIKRTDGGTNNWVIFDSARNTYNATGKELKANTSAAEYDGDSTNPNDFLSNGLKIRHDGTAMNIASGTYIVAAWAENPFKNSNAR